MTITCVWKSCRVTTERPGKEGWSWLADWPPPISDGLYCPDHARAIEDDLISGACEWCEREPAIVNLGDGGRLYDACSGADDEEWAARRALNV
jgi:hypothetical protein